MIKSLIWNFYPAIKSIVIGVILAIIITTTIDVVTAEYSKVIIGVTDELISAIAASEDDENLFWMWNQVTAYEKVKEI